ncbi:winged helix-turn-helix domain-containing protein [Dyella sp. C11]|uniref:ATP-binding protein n=1 Tax=Dyella sp. C11 TaxID=2126991 RepID=UPI000D655A77|nr:winged helix-turn-helix domain-containing protein [Dyella sp. C11]
MRDIHAMTTRPTMTSGRRFEFGPWVYQPEKQLLLRDNTAVVLGNRALEILGMLVERPGELIEKEEIIARVWPTTIVEESNLKVHVAALRKALHDGLGDERYIATVVGRGYRFVAPVMCHRTEQSSRMDGCCGPGGAGRSGPFARDCPSFVVGRSTLINDILNQLPARRFMSLVGPGGVGKTTVAKEVAGLITTRRHMEVVYVDLAEVAEGRLVAGAILGAIGFTARSVNARTALMDQLRDREMLLVLDGAEALLGPVAEMVEKINACSRDTHILVTSREPLFARGEHVLRIPPLSCPDEGMDLDEVESRRYAAVELFIERASAAGMERVLTHADMSVVARLCRRLDGIPLAIELAASRVNAFDLAKLEQLLEGDLRLLGQGRRNAPGRLRTLTASVEWSYALLAEPEQRLLRRLAIFSHEFSLSDAEIVASQHGLGREDIAEWLGNLVSKSLVMACPEQDPACYRLLTTTRCFARQKLAQHFELEDVRRRHAEYCLKVVAAHSTRQHANDADGHAQSRLGVGDIRDALGWATAANEAHSLAIDIAVAAMSSGLDRHMQEDCSRVLTMARTNAAAVFVKGAVKHTRLSVVRADDPAHEESLPA